MEISDCFMTQKNSSLCLLPLGTENAITSHIRVELSADWQQSARRTSQPNPSHRKIQHNVISVKLLTNEGTRNRQPLNTVKFNRNILSYRQVTFRVWLILCRFKGYIIHSNCALKSKNSQHSTGIAILNAFLNIRSLIKSTEIALFSQNKHTENEHD
jgi:hypothetical protein